MTYKKLQTSAGQYHPHSDTHVEASNLLISAATPLLTLITQIKHTSEHYHVEKLFAQITVEIKKFTDQLLILEQE